MYSDIKYEISRPYHNTFIRGTTSRFYLWEVRIYLKGAYSFIKKIQAASKFRRRFYLREIFIIIVIIVVVVVTFCCFLYGRLLSFRILSMLIVHSEFGRKNMMVTTVGVFCIWKKIGSLNNQ